MSLLEFEQLLDTYGADPMRWPEALRAEATAFMASSEEAQSLCRDAVALDGLLDQAPAGEMSGALLSNILASGPAAQQSTLAPAKSSGLIGKVEDFIGALWPQFGWIRPAGLMTATMAFGFYMGIAAPNSIAQSSDETELFASIYSLPSASDWDASDWEPQPWDAGDWDAGDRQ